jgi:hypothetical protein
MIERRVTQIIVLVGVQLNAQTGRYAPKANTLSYLPDRSADGLQPKNHPVGTAVAAAEKHLHDEVKTLPQVYFVGIPDRADSPVFRRRKLITIIVKR